MKYKKILLILIVYLLLCNFDVFAKDVQVFFITEGGSTNTNGFKIVDDYVNRTDGTYCATYKSNGTIKTLNSINGASFSIYKSGTNLVSGKEWYTYNYSNNKLYYFNQSKSYNVDELLQKLSMRGDPYPVISLFAHWNGDGVDGGTDIGGTAKNASSNNKKTSKKSDKIIKIKSISISGNSRITKGKSTTLKVTYKPSNAKKETITWSSSNKKIASVNSSGKVTGLSKGTVTITAKTSSGKKSTFKVTIVEEVIHKVKISFHMNGGKLGSLHMNSISSSGNNVISVKTNSTIIQTIPYGSSTNSVGLYNYNNPKYLNIERAGYIAKNGAEWNTKPDGSGKSYSDKKVYKASDFCNAKSNDCKVTLYVNWKKKKNYVYIKFNMNGGRLVKYHGKNTSVSGNKVLCYGKEECQQIEYGKSITPGGLFDYNNNWGVNILRKGYYVIPGREWNTKPDGTGKSYNQKKIYKSSDFCNAKDKDCGVTLYVNWKANPMKSGFEIEYWKGPSADVMDASKAQLIKEAGFTTIQLHNIRSKDINVYRSEMDKAIKILNSRNIKVIVQTKDNYKKIIYNNTWDDAKWNKELLDMVAFYSRYRNVVGYHIIDEPEDLKYFSKIGKVFNVVKKYDSQRYSYCNILGSDDKIGINGKYKYSTYLDSYVKNVKPSIISFDRYPAIFANLSPYNNSNFSNARYNAEKASYYTTLNMVHSKATKSGIKPMTVLLVSQLHMENFLVGCRNLSQNEIAFQVSVALALGMKSISYYNYSNVGAKYENNAMLDDNYQPTKHYYDVKKVNSWAYPIGKELYNKKIRNVYGINEVKSLTSYNNSLGKINTDKTGILTIFNDNSFMLVNTDLVKNTNNTFTFDGKTTKLSSMEWFNPSSSRWEVLPNGSNIYMSVNKTKNTISIPVGHCVLLRRK